MNWLNKILFYLKEAFLLQCFITLFLLPFLLSRGLPISLLLFVGNIIFSPILLIFIFLTFIAYGLSLIGLYISWLFYSIDFFAYWWIKIMNISILINPLVYFPYRIWVWPLSIGSFFLLLTIRKIRKNNLYFTLIVYSSFVFILFFIKYLPNNLKKFEHKEIEYTYNNSCIKIKDKRKKIYKKSIESKWNYDFLPIIAKEYGSIEIKEYSIDQSLKNSYFNSFLNQQSNIEAITYFSE